MANHNILQELVKSGAQDVQAGALETIGNLAFCRANRYLVLHTATLMQRLRQIAHSSLGTTTTLGRHAACRALAILGEPCKLPGESVVTVQMYSGTVPSDGSGPSWAQPPPWSGMLPAARSRSSVRFPG